MRGAALGKPAESATDRAALSGSAGLPEAEYAIMVCVRKAQPRAPFARDAIERSCAGLMTNEMDEPLPLGSTPHIPWYAESALVGPGRVYATGSLAQCLRKWN